VVRRLVRETPCEHAQHNARNVPLSASGVLFMGVMVLATFLLALNGAVRLEEAVCALSRA
jgi:hypothetical protein